MTLLWTSNKGVMEAGFPTWEVVGKLTYLMCNCFHSSMTFVEYANTIWCKLCEFVHFD
jgi:hypothetical protein